MAKATFLIIKPRFARCQPSHVVREFRKLVLIAAFHKVKQTPNSSPRAVIGFNKTEKSSITFRFHEGADRPSYTSQFFRHQDIYVCLLQSLRQMPLPFETGFSLSVVVATYQRPDQTTDLTRSLWSSVEKFRRQRETSLNFECIVCCSQKDKATVQALENVEWSELEVVTTDRRAASHNRHVGFQQAEGAYVAVVDSDCLVADDWVGSVHDALQQNDYPDVLQGAYFHDYPAERTWYTRVEADEDRSRFNDSQADSRNIVFRRSSYFEIGGYDNQHLHADAAEDLVLRSRVKNEGGSFKMAEDVQVYHRYPPGLIDNLARYNRYGRGTIYVKAYYPNLYDQFSPTAFTISTLGEIRAYLFSPNSTITGRMVLYRLLKTVSFVIGFVQGLFVYWEERSEMSGENN